MVTLVYLVVSVSVIITENVLTGWFQCVGWHQSVYKKEFAPFIVMSGVSNRAKRFIHPAATVYELGHYRVTHL